jgi:pimeloyl-ACP methyl ester carboxylesterase
MTNIKSNQLVLAALILAILMVAVLVYVRYRNDLQAARSRLEELDSQVVTTPCGPIQYATYGDGYPVLVVHGIFGGLDQGLVLARSQLGEEFLSIIPSRFGYLKTPLPQDASPAEQADAFACLLDVVGIDKAAIMGTSAGGTSAIQFTLRHTERCSALVLVSSNAPGEAGVGLPPRPMANVLFRSNFIFWLLTTYFPSSMYSIMGVPRNFDLTPAQTEEMKAVMDTLLPAKPRADGALFDMYVSNPDINTGYPLQDISVPTLITHAVDDPLARYESARALAKKIPDARLFTIESGGHPLLGHEARILSEITGFLEGSVGE